MTTEIVKAANQAASDLAGRLNLPHGVKITATGLEGHTGLSNDDMLAVTVVLLDKFYDVAVQGQALQWAIGDILVAGEKRYGSTYTDMLAQTGYAYSTLNVNRWVASRVPKNMRRPSLPHSTHKIIAADNIPPIEKKQWLDAAEKNEWTTEALREAIEDDTITKAGKDPAEEKARVALAKAADRVYALAPPQWPGVIIRHLVRDLADRLGDMPKHTFIRAMAKAASDLRRVDG